MSGQIPASAIVLAGGRSTRFGSDKAAAQLAGRPMLEWVVAAVGSVCEDVVVVGGPERSLPGTRYIPDPGPPRGPLGGIVTTPVINRPEVAIVGVNRIVERPVIRAGLVVARSVMNLSSSFDHRVVDGMHAAQFVQALRGYLECPATMFVD